MKTGGRAQEFASCYSRLESVSLQNRRGEADAHDKADGCLQCELLPFSCVGLWQRLNSARCPSCRTLQTRRSPAAPHPRAWRSPRLPPPAQPSFFFRSPGQTQTGWLSPEASSASSAIFTAAESPVQAQCLDCILALIHVPMRTFLENVPSLLLSIDLPRRLRATHEVNRQHLARNTAEKRELPRRCSYHYAKNKTNDWIARTTSCRPALCQYVTTTGRFSSVVSRLVGHPAGFLNDSDTTGNMVTRR